jgi:Fe2+ or Zn2+ uptake regulation protein
MTLIMISQDLRTTGLSKNHRLVYDIVREQGVGTHLPMTQVFELARARQSAIGFTTVYRALSRLRDLGLVAEICMPGSECAVYEPAAPPHANFRCTACAVVEDVPYAVSEAVTTQLAADHGYAIDRVEVALTGLCPRCKS